MEILVTFSGRGVIGLMQGSVSLFQPSDSAAFLGARARKAGSPGGTGENREGQGTRGFCLESGSGTVLGLARVFGTTGLCSFFFCPCCGLPGAPGQDSSRGSGAAVPACSRRNCVISASLREFPLNDTIDDLTIAYEDDNGHLIIKELDKVILTRGAWTTILFRYQEWRPERDDYGPDKYTLRRYKKSAGTYRPQSKFTISSPDQARKIIDALNGWLGETEEK